MLNYTCPRISLNSVSDTQKENMKMQWGLAEKKGRNGIKDAKGSVSMCLNLSWKCRRLSNSLNVFFTVGVH